MAKFRKGGSKATPGISTASLPDIVFMLLFFFMVVVKMRNNEMKVKTAMPTASEVEKLEKKSWVNFIFVGPPVDATFGTTPRIQLNDAFAGVGQVQEFIVLERQKVDEKVVPYLTTSIKADRDVKMGIITDIKQELRKIRALKLNYSASKVKRVE